MNGPWLAAILAASVAVGYLLTGITRAARRHYRGRHRMHTPGRAHPARRATYIDMCRLTLHDPAAEAEIAWLEDLFAKDSAE